MENERGELMDLYVPRQCSATGRLIPAKDHASATLSIANVSEDGRYNGEVFKVALCGFVRAMGEADDSINRLAQEAGYLQNVFNPQGSGF